MNRRDFVRTTLATGLTFGLGSRLLPGTARADLPPNDQRTVLNITLRGGPDFRHLIAPPFEADPDSYGYAYWSHRRRAHGIGNTPAEWEARWQQDYHHVQIDGVAFGVLKKATWLKDQLEAGNVAIVSNVLASTTRDHSHSLLIYESGDRTTGRNDFTRDGWGGRLAGAANGRVVSMTGQVRLFCNGSHPTDPGQHDNEHVIAAANTREIALYRADELDAEPSSGNARPVLSRALESYYAAKRAELPSSSVFHRFVVHEKTYRTFGSAVEARLDEVPLPESVQGLYEGATPLSSTALGRQLRNAHDTFACSDIFGFRVGSLMVDGFDSHKNQQGAIEPSYEDLFGADRGLATLFSEVGKTMPTAIDNTVVVIGGEFGRQLRDNGDSGTDHGRGNAVLVIGDAVKGGLYGDLFPAGEIPRYNEPSADILGLTALERVYAAICDWVEPGSAAQVLGDVSSSELESGVDLTSLLPA